jgi:hypothetical protein
MAVPRRSGTSATIPASTGYMDVSELERYQLLSNIGKGSFGVISKVRRVEDGRVSRLPDFFVSGYTWNILPSTSCKRSSCSRLMAGICLEAIRLLQDDRQGPETDSCRGVSDIRSVHCAWRHSLVVPVALTRPLSVFGRLMLISVPSWNLSNTATSCSWSKRLKTRRTR